MKTGARQPARPSKDREIGKRGVEEVFVRRCKGKVLKFFPPKFWTPANKGAPDRIVFKGIDTAITLYMIETGFKYSVAESERRLREIIDSVLEFVELKAPGKKPQPHQTRYHDKLRALGFKVSVIDNKADAKAFDGN